MTPVIAGLLHIDDNGSTKTDIGKTSTMATRQRTFQFHMFSKLKAHSFDVSEYAGCLRRMFDLCAISRVFVVVCLKVRLWRVHFVELFSSIVVVSQSHAEKDKEYESEFCT